MNLDDAIASLNSQLQQIQIKEEQNQQEQAAINQIIQELEQKIQQQYQRQSELDRDAIELYRQAEEINLKLTKLAKIATFSQQFQALKAECQDNQELLQTLYSTLPIPFDRDTLSGVLNERNLVGQKVIQDLEPIHNNDYETSFITLEKIKNALPNAESTYKQLVARYLEEYQAYQNVTIDDLDLIWCSLAFMVFGRSSYRKLSLKHHPDLEGSQRGMQLINAAWEISQDYLNHVNNTVES